MNRSSPSIPLGIALGVIAPVAMLDSLAGAERHAMGMTAATFGNLRLLAAHALAAAPLAVVVAAAIVRRLGPRRSIPWDWALLGLLVGAIMGLASGAIGEAMTAAGVGLAGRSAWRTLAVLLVELPWMVAALRRADLPDPPGPGWGAVTVAVASALAQLPPAVFADRICASRRGELDAHLETGRLARAAAALESWIDLGGAGAIGDLPADRLRRSLRAELLRLDRRARLPIPSEAPAELVLERGFVLIGLDRLEEAEALLRRVSGSSTEAALLRAATLRDLDRWDQCDRQYRAVLEARLPALGRDPLAEEHCAMAFDGIAEASRKAGRSDRAEAAYRAAIRALPGRAADFTVKLGVHYLDGGRPAAALAQFREAIALDPSRSAAVAPMIRSLRVASPGCLLRPPGSSGGDDRRP